MASLAPDASWGKRTGLRSDPIPGASAEHGSPHMAGGQTGSDKFASSPCHGFQVLISPTWFSSAENEVLPIVTACWAYNDPGAPSENGPSPTMVPALAPIVSGKLLSPAFALVALSPTPLYTSPCHQPPRQPLPVPGQTPPFEGGDCFLTGNFLTKFCTPTFLTKTPYHIFTCLF